MTASTMAADGRMRRLTTETRRAAATLQCLQTEVDYYTVDYDTDDPASLVDACHALEARLADLASALADLASVKAHLDRIDAELAELVDLGQMRAAA